jgi:hypothetical protein
MLLHLELVRESDPCPRWLLPEYEFALLGPSELKLPYLLFPLIIITGYASTWLLFSFWDLSATARDLQIQGIDLLEFVSAL